MTVETDPERGVFRAGGATVPGSHVEARALVEARLPEPTVDRTRDPLLRELYEDGAAATPAGLLAVDPDDGRILDRAGTPPPAPLRARPAHRRPRLRRLRPAPYQRPRVPAERRDRPRPAAGLRDLSCRARSPSEPYPARKPRFP